MRILTEREMMMYLCMCVDKYCTNWFWRLCSLRSLSTGKLISRKAMEERSADLFLLARATGLLYKLVLLGSGQDN